MDVLSGLIFLKQIFRTFSVPCGGYALAWFTLFFPPIPVGHAGKTGRSSLPERDPTRPPFPRANDSGSGTFYALPFLIANPRYFLTRRHTVSWYVDVFTIQNNRRLPIAAGLL